MRRAFHLASLEAGGAHVHALASAVDESAHALNIRVPTAAGPHVGVRDAFAEARVLAADFADRGHDFLLRTLTGRQRRLFHANDDNPSIIAIAVFLVQTKLTVASDTLRYSEMSSRRVSDARPPLPRSHSRYGGSADAMRGRRGPF